MVSKNSTIMFHQASSMISGKMTDVTATVDFVKQVEGDIYDMLSNKTNKTADWWKGKQWKAFLGLSLSGKHSNRGEFLRSWQRIPEGSTRREQTAQGVNTLIEAIPYFLSTSKRTRELACSLSQMLNSVT
jgi:hypothetical protein